MRSIGRGVVRKRIHVAAISLTLISLMFGHFVIITAHNTTKAQQQGEMTAQMRRDIINNLRARYREVSPKLRSVALECNSEMRDTLRGVIEPAQSWLGALEQIGIAHSLTEEDVNSTEMETLIRDRVAAEGLTGRDYQNRVRALTRSGIVVTESELKRIERDRLRRDGYNDQEIEDILKEADAVRAEFQKMSDELTRLIWDTLKKAYDKAHECCMKDAKEFYLTMMDGLGRQLTVATQGQSVSMEKRNECLCMIESVTAGQGGAWTGEITHTERFVDDRNEILGSGSRQNKYYKKHDYRAVINLVYHTRSIVAGPAGSSIPAQVSASGGVDSNNAIENRWKSVDIDKRQGRETIANYRGNLSGEESTVDIQINPDGTYNVSYVAPCIDATGTQSTRLYTLGTGFPEHQKRDDTENKAINRNVCPTQSGVRLRDGQFVGIRGQLDLKSTKTVSGSKTFEVPLDENPEVFKTITVTWRLKRCK